MATVKWMKYKAIVTKVRLKKYAAVTWLFPLLTTVPGIIMQAFGHPSWTYVTRGCCIGCIGHFLGCMQNRTQIHSVNSLVRAKVETKIAYTTFLVTFFFGISGIPTVIAYSFGKFHFSMGRYNASVKLSRQSTTVLL